MSTFLPKYSRNSQQKNARVGAKREGRWLGFLTTTDFVNTIRPKVGSIRLHKTGTPLISSSHYSMIRDIILPENLGYRKNTQ